MFVIVSVTVSSSWQTLLTKGTPPVNVTRYFKFLSAQPIFKEVQAKFAAAQPKATPEKGAVAPVCYSEGIMISKATFYNNHLQVTHSNTFFLYLSTR